jgi:hypothetical protein
MEALSQFTDSQQRNNTAFHYETRSKGRSCAGKNSPHTEMWIYGVSFTMKPSLPPVLVRTLRQIHVIVEISCHYYVVVNHRHSPWSILTLRNALTTCEPQLRCIWSQRYHNCLHWSWCRPQIRVTLEYPVITTLPLPSTVTLLANALSDTQCLRT